MSNALAASQSLQDALTAAWWAGEYPTTETALEVARRLDSALNSGKPLSAEELVLGTAILASASLYRMSKAERYQVTSVAIQCLDSAIDSEPLWALPRLLKIALMQEHITETTPEVWDGGNRGTLLWAQVPDNVVYDVLAQMRQMTFARDFSVVLAPPWLARVKNVGEVPAPLNSGSLSQRTLVQVEGVWITEATWMLCDRLFRKKDWKGVADMLRFYASLLNFSPELFRVHWQAVEGFEEILRRLQEQRKAWSGIPEFKDYAEQIKDLENSARKPPSEIEELRGEKWRVAMETWARDKYAKMGEIMLKCAELLEAK